jgi:hypothetical protein
MYSYSMIHQCFTCISLNNHSINFIFWKSVLIDFRQIIIIFKIIKSCKEVVKTILHFGCIISWWMTVHVSLTFGCSALLAWKHYSNLLIHCSPLFSEEQLVHSYPSSPRGGVLQLAQAGLQVGMADLDFELKKHNECACLVAPNAVEKVN